MSKKYDSISNYNLSYENFIDAINEFDGYILGLSNNTLEQLLAVDAGTPETEYSKKGTTELKENNKESEDNKESEKAIGKEFLDRTTGAYLVNDLNDKNSLTDDLGKDFEIVTTEFNSGNENGFASALIVKSNEVINDITSLEHYSIREVLQFKDVDLKQESLQNDQGESIKNSDGTVKMYYASGSIKDNKSLEFLPESASDASSASVKKGESEGIKDLSPNIAACVCKNPRLGMMGTSKSHLGIFFNAIPKIEMSKCVPYIDIKILTEDYSSKKSSAMDAIRTFRFEKDDYGNFVNLAERSVSESANTNDKRTDSLTRTFMDVFTTTQTFSNADINRVNSPSWQNLKSAGETNNDVILEPLMPLMSLDTLTVSITGAGYGLMSTKKASMSIKLHDRSRMKDIAPLISVEEFATTKVIIEYGWNHPQGGVNSDNVIAKYLNGLKERSIFQVTGTDYSFSGNVVDINVKLSAYGYRQTDKVHAGCGPSLPLNVVSDLIQKATNDLIGEIEEKENAPEVRQKVKLNARSARSTTSTISWSKMKEIKASLSSNREPESVLNDIKEMLKSDGKSENDNSRLGVDKEKSVIKGLYGKLLSIKDPSSPDPFVTSFVKNASNYTYSNIKTHKEIFEKVCNLTSDGGDTKNQSYVSLGKIIMHYVAVPMASTCMYDEVQVFFYPLNHHAGKARIHTTASFPVSIDALENLINEKIKENPNISVKRFFSILEKNILNDRSARPYGFADMDALKKKKILGKVKTVNDKIAIVNDAILNGSKLISGALKSDDIDNKIKKYAKDNKKDTTFWQNLFNKSKEESIESFDVSDDLKIKDDELAKLQKRYGELYSKIAEESSKEYRNELEGLCKKYYTSDGITQFAEPKFIKPNFSIDFEVVPVLASPNPENEIGKELGWWDNVKSSLFNDQTVTNGIQEGRAILRIHVYDEEAIASPEESMLLSAATGDFKNFVGGAGSSNIEAKSAIANNLSFYDVKQIVKSNYPTIIFGSENSLVKSISSQASTSGQLSNVLMVEAYGDLRSGKVKAHNDEPDFEEVTILPNNITVECAGIPMIGRGNNIFIDFGTNTSLDNIYAVKTVSHNINKSGFKTSLSLAPIDQQSISNFKNKITSLIDGTKKNELNNEE